MCFHLYSYLPNFSNAMIPLYPPFKQVVNNKLLIRVKKEEAYTHELVVVHELCTFRDVHMLQFVMIKCSDLTSIAPELP
jgi:hypothetical protein